MRQYESLNYYELLGVSETASADEIRSAYREMARVYHPDSTFYDEIIVSRSSDDSRRVFQIITTAYSTLIDDEKRSFYDRTLRQESERRRIIGSTAPGLRTLTMRRDVLLSQMDPDVPGYEEIEGSKACTSSVADFIKTKKSKTFTRSIYLFLFISAVALVVCLISLALPA